MAMIYYALACFIVAAVVGLLGFSVLAGTVAWIAKTLFYIFIATLLLSLVAYKQQHIPEHRRA